MYTGQGRILYSNNGEPGWSVTGDPGLNAAAGALAENTGSNLSNSWRVIERNNFCEITGPGGIHGPSSDQDPIWATGWDNRSVLLKLLDAGVWHTFRLPKASFTHDALHGWYTEWPRIREIVDGKMLMHMHGMFYDFPKTFCATNTSGILPICTYLKMPVDYCWWNGELVMARDDTSTTGGNSWAGQSHSAPWFGQLSDLRQWGSPAGFGGPWRQDSVSAGVSSDPFLVGGFENRLLHLRNGGTQPIAVQLEVSTEGNVWAAVTNLNVSGQGYTWYLMPKGIAATWARLRPDRNGSNVTAWFHLSNPARKSSPQLFAGIADITDKARSEGIIRPRVGGARTLQFAATTVDANGTLSQAYYEIDGAFQLRRATNTSADNALRTTHGLNTAGFGIDKASVIVTEAGQRFRGYSERSLPDVRLRAQDPGDLARFLGTRDLPDVSAHGNGPACAQEN